MKKILIIAVISLIAVTSYASQKAITDTGKEVILKDNGTWQYSDDARESDTKIEINKNVFTKPANSSFLLKSTKNKSAYWINKDKWSFGQGRADTAVEYKFQLKGADLYGLAINESIEFSIEALVDLAIINFREAGKDVKIIKKEYRIVNGKKLIYMETATTVMKSIKATYLGYYYSDPSGSTQLLTYTASSLVDKYKPEIEDFLNGLVTQ